MRFRPVHNFGLLIEAHENQSLNANMIRELREAYPLVLLRGFQKLSREDLVALCAADPGKELLHWSFGPVMEMKEDESSPNYLFSNEEVPFHWDGAFHRVPGSLVFYCVQAPPEGCGGQTLFANTAAIARDLEPARREEFARLEIIYRTEKLAHYGGEIREKLLQRHPRTGAEILRFAEPVKTAKNPVESDIDGALLAEMREKVYSPRYCYEHQWREGDLLIADNHALIHGRRAFTKNVPRHLRRLQIL
jgi:alpha-ketoglutarate-dependent taurine dioxygenase